MNQLTTETNTEPPAKSTALCWRQRPWSCQSEGGEWTCWGSVMFSSWFGSWLSWDWRPCLHQGLLRGRSCCLSCEHKSSKFSVVSATFTPRVLCGLDRKRSPSREARAKANSTTFALRMTTFADTRHTVQRVQVSKASRSKSKGDKRPLGLGAWSCAVLKPEDEHYIESSRDYIRLYRVRALLVSQKAL